MKVVTPRAIKIQDLVDRDGRWQPFAEMIEF
jgi:hypothetical protein